MTTKETMNLIKKQAQEKLDKDLNESLNAMKNLDPMLSKKKMVHYLNNRIN